MHGFMQVRTFGPLLVAGCALASALVPSARTDTTDRPERYSPHWGQYFVQTFSNPRQVSILRLGAGERRRAEYWVFEWTDRGQRLRPLHQSTLRTDWVPLTWRAEGDGRFLVTFDDRFAPRGSTDRCVVIYDFVRGESVAKRADDFVPQPWLESLSIRRKWSCGPAWVDPLLHRIYPSMPADVRKGTSPYVVVDLPSLSVSVEEAPEQWPARVHCETADGHAWEWEFSMGNADEPAWLAESVLPTYLAAERVRDFEGSNLFDAGARELVFRLDPESGSYRRCASEEWRPPPATWGGMKK